MADGMAPSVPFSPCSCRPYSTPSRISDRKSLMLRSPHPCPSRDCFERFGFQRSNTLFFNNEVPTIFPAHLQKVPNLDCIVARACSQHSSVRMESHTRHPITVSFAAHEKIAIWHRPDFPRLVVAYGSNDRLFIVYGRQSKGTYASGFLCIP